MKKRRVTVVAKSMTDWYVYVVKANGVEKQYGPFSAKEAVYWFDRLKKRK